MIENKKPKFFYGYVIVSAAFLIMAVLIGMLYSFGVFFEPVLVEFGWTRAATSGAFSLTVIIGGIMAMVAGKLNDRFGPRLLVTAGGLLVGLGCSLTSQISAIWQLYLFYGVMVGIGSGALFVPTLSTVARWFVKRMGIMTGIAYTGIGIGTMTMPPLANWLISKYGWSNSFIIIGIITAVLITVAAQFLRRDPQSMGLLPDGGTEVKQQNSNLEASGLSLREAIHTSQLWLLCAAFLCLGFSAFAIMLHIKIHATGLGISDLIATSIYTTIGAVSIAGRIVVGSAADRIGSRLTLIISFAMLSAAFFWLSFAKEVWMLYLFAAIFGLAYSTTMLEAPSVAELFGLRSHGVLMGMVDLSVTIGAAIGPVLIGYIFDITDSYQLGFLIFAGMSIIALILALFLKPISSVVTTNST